MNNVQYNDFLAVACDLAGRLAHDKIELITSDNSHIRIDPESELRLCIEDPGGLEQTRRSLENFEKAVYGRERSFAGSEYGQA